ncbi:MAG: hypothetical protein NTU79_04330 [Planctomycetota bacterium]|nr:hypothetical protein [Planctomycetota bacterium]
MRLKIYFAVATLLVASVTRADDYFTNAGQTRRETTKPVASASQNPKQSQTAVFTEDLSTRAIDKGNVKLVQYSRADAGQQPVVDNPAPVQSQSFFGRIMELERRKNAWLRRTFLGRE